MVCSVLLELQGKNGFDGAGRPEGAGFGRRDGGWVRRECGRIGGAGSSLRFEYRLKGGRKRVGGREFWL